MVRSRRSFVASYRNPEVFVSLRSAPFSQVSFRRRLQTLELGKSSGSLGKTSLTLESYAVQRSCLCLVGLQRVASREC